MQMFEQINVCFYIYFVLYLVKCHIVDCDHSPEKNQKKNKQKYNFSGIKSVVS